MRPADAVRRKLAKEAQFGEPPMTRDIPTDTNIRNIPVGMGVDPAAANRFNTRKPL